MGKGSRNREIRIVAGQASNNGAVKLSKKQRIRLEQKKARQKKMVTIGATIAILVAIIVTIFAVTIGNQIDLEGTVGATYGENEAEIDNAMIAYFMYGQYNNFVNENYYYLNYYGLTPGQSLKSQTLKGTTQTWFAFFLDAAESQIDELVALSSAAAEKGMTLGEKEYDEIDEYMDELKTYAKKNGFGSVDKYLSATYVQGVTGDAVRRCMELQKHAMLYYDYLLETYVYEDEDFEKYVEENPDKFYKFDYMYYDFAAEYDSKTATDDDKKAAYEKAKKEAEGFLAAYTESAERFGEGIVIFEKLKEEASKPATGTGTGTGTGTAAGAAGGAKAATTTSGTADSTVGTDGLTEEEKKEQQWIDKYTAKGKYYNKDNDFFVWAFEDDRKADEAKIIYDDENYTCTVYYLQKTAYKDDYTTQNVRHILFLTSDFDSKEDAKAKAEEVLALYNKGEKTAEAFGELAKEYTADGNGDEGGLYEDVMKNQMVTEFEDWIYDEDRKEGDVEIILTESYGYHIMYYVGEGRTAWKVTADNYLKNEAYEADLKLLLKKYPVEYNYDNIVEIP